MRDTLFRGKRHSDGKWRYGSYIIVYDKMTDWNLPKDHRMTPIHPYTLKNGHIEDVGNIYDGLEDDKNDHV